MDRPLNQFASIVGDVMFDLERARLDAPVEERISGLAEAPGGPASGTRLPRCLLIDWTKFGGSSATGELKRTYFAAFGPDNLLQVYFATRGKIGVAPAGDPTRDGARIFDKSDPGLYDAVRAFAPEVIVYRPVADAPILHAAAMNMVRTLGIPCIVWLMDDWPERLRVTNPGQHEAMDSDLRELLAGAADRFAICESMADAFQDRYGCSFKIFRNGATPEDWVPLRRQPDAEGRLRIRYAGSLAPDTTRESVLDVATAVEELGARHPISFEIRTHAHWHSAERSRYADFKHVSFSTSDLDYAAYRQWLADADVLVIAYNFDPDTIRYLRHSFANKTPEYLASGAAVLAYGPPAIATMDFLASRRVAAVVDRRDANDLKRTIEQLIEDPARRSDLAAASREIAFSVLGLDKQLHDFQGSLRAAAARPSAIPDKTYPALSREAKANVDETEVVSKLYSSGGVTQRIMLDVGAHFGTSAKYFQELGWRIHCFEPDPSNRKHLIDRFGKAPNVTIDPRAVSDAPAKGISFFTSEESTGISGLHAFRGSHKEAGRVDVTTVAEIVKEYGISHVDFLKIDVEGFDFSVIKGVPWDHIRPDVIECEFEDAKTLRLGHTYGDVADFLVGKGYAVYLSEWHPIVRYGIRHDWCRVIRYPEALRTSDAWGNILAFKYDPGMDAVQRAFASCLDIKGPSAVPVDGLLKDTRNAPVAAPPVRAAVAAPVRQAESGPAAAGQTVQPLRREPPSVAEVAKASAQVLAETRVPIGQARAVILGNGPSLQGFDFSRLKPFDVFGMNAAYRYWDLINWYPRFYSCLDAVVGMSHADEIARLVRKAATTESSASCFGVT